MNVKFDDGEHANIVPLDRLGTVPDIGDRIDWESEPETERDLPTGRYRVEQVVWLLGSKVTPLVTVHLVLRD